MTEKGKKCNKTKKRDDEGIVKMRILIGMSGGIDSSFAAQKLKNDGHEVVGAVLVMHDYTDVGAARRAAERVGIPLCEVDCRSDFDKYVKEYFVREYSLGRTPNPCIVCNREVKFRYLYDYATENGFDRIATGHYARVVERDGRYAIERALDTSKDQTYMLYRLSQNILGMLVLPLADMTKGEVKRLATEQGLIDEGQKESQEICFIPDNDYRSYVEGRLGKFPSGCFVDENGNVLGKHDGIIGYTVGQRKGLGISLGARAFVSRIDPEKNEITLSTDGGSTTSIRVSETVYSGVEGLGEGEQLRADVKVRYRATPVPATLTGLGDGRVRIDFDTPIKSVAPGQSAVAYVRERVMLGGFID